jgi:hypothetical protein
MTLGAEPRHTLETVDRLLKRTDRFLIWPLWIPIAAALVFTTAWSFGSGFEFLALILGAPVICGWLICMPVAAGLAVWRRAWRRFTSLVAILVCAVPATVASLMAGDHIHLLLAVPYYAAEIAAAPAGTGPIHFHWSSAGLIPSYERTLVYDSSAELTSQAGKCEPVPAEPAVTWCIRHLMGRFYLSEMSWRDSGSRNGRIFPTLAS